MTSKEALSDLLNMADYCLEEDERKQIKQEYKIILKDLEVLEIIKRKKVAIFLIPYCKNAYDYSMKTIGFEALTDKEFKLIKEWLDND